MHAILKRLPKKGDGHYRYLHVYESVREGGKVKKRFVASLGNVEGKGAEELSGIAVAVPRLARKLQGRSEAVASEQALRFGEVAALRSVWRSRGLHRILERLAKQRKHEFDLEQAVFAMVAQRLVDPGSKLACVRWLSSDVFMPKAAGLDEDETTTTCTRR